MNIPSAAMSTVGTLITMLLKLVDASAAKAGIDAFLDTLEARISASPNRADDWALPAIAKAREIMGIQ